MPETRQQNPTTQAPESFANLVFLFGLFRQESGPPEMQNVWRGSAYAAANRECFALLVHRGQEAFFAKPLFQGLLGNRQRFTRVARHLLSNPVCRRRLKVKVVLLNPSDAIAERRPLIRTAVAPATRSSGTMRFAARAFGLVPESTYPSNMSQYAKGHGSNRISLPPFRSCRNSEIPGPRLQRPFRLGLGQSCCLRT
jgi:hypothetical protein